MPIRPRQLPQPLGLDKAHEQFSTCPNAKSLYRARTVRVMDRTSALQLAERIYAQAVREATTTDVAGIVKRIHEKLAQALSPMIGDAGFAAMMARTIQMARAEYPRLDGAVGFSVEPFPENLASWLEGQEPALIQAVGVALLARFLVLLSTLIGTELALRLLSPTWPDAIAYAIDSAEKL